MTRPTGRAPFLAEPGSGAGEGVDDSAISPNATFRSGRPQRYGRQHLLVVHHSPSPTLDQMLDQVVAGTQAEGLEEVTVVVRPALDATVDDALAADGYVLGTPANLGYMSGALKHFFDVVYPECLDRTVGRPYGMYLHGHSDVDGARLAIEKITTGLQWRLAQAPVQSVGPLTDDHRTACWELGATLAAVLLP